MAPAGVQLFEVDHVLVKGQINNYCGSVIYRASCITTAAFIVGEGDKEAKTLEQL